MLRSAIYAVLFVLLPLTVRSGSVSFQDTEVGSLPKGWKSGDTDKGHPFWYISPMPDSPGGGFALIQSGSGTFPWCVLATASVQNGFVESKIKPIGGSEDQAGGVIWRFKDSNNYYIVRSNALEGNVVPFKVENGTRHPLPIRGGDASGYGVKAEIRKGEWHCLRVEFNGALFTAFLDDKKLFEVEDHTFVDAGAVGVWTKADSVTVFDAFQFETNKENTP